MRKTVVYAVLVAVVMMLSCNGRKHDVAYYEQMIDSIRKAEQVKEMEKQAGIYKDPVKAWFDTLHLRSLPIQTAGADVDRIASFTSVPMKVNENFGFPSSTHLKAVALPSRYRHPVILLCEMQDSITPSLYLYTMDSHWQPIDILSIYQQLSDNRDEDEGEVFNEYYITSQYEIMVMRYFQSHNRKHKPLLEEARLYTIGKDGHFEEVPIEL